ncbi:hypothetical protein ILYODFUR_031264, partial [Ilyodon furcidens]
AVESPVKPQTSLPQQWHKPRGAKIKAVPISAVFIAKGIKKTAKGDLLTAATQGAANNCVVVDDSILPWNKHGSFT